MFVRIREIILANPLSAKILGGCFLAMVINPRDWTVAIFIYTLMVAGFRAFLPVRSLSIIAGAAISIWAGLAMALDFDFNHGQSAAYWSIYSCLCMAALTTGMLSWIAFHNQSRKIIAIPLLSMAVVLAGYFLDVNEINTTITRAKEFIQSAEVIVDTSHRDFDLITNQDHLITIDDLDRALLNPNICQADRPGLEAMEKHFYHIGHHIGRNVPGDHGLVVISKEDIDGYEAKVHRWFDQYLIK